MRLLGLSEFGKYVLLCCGVTAKRFHSLVSTGKRVVTITIGSLSHRR